MDGIIDGATSQCRTLFKLYCDIHKFAAHDKRRCYILSCPWTNLPGFLHPSCQVIWIKMFPKCFVWRYLEGGRQGSFNVTSRGFHSVIEVVFEQCMLVQLNEFWKAMKIRIFQFINWKLHSTKTSSFDLLITTSFAKYQVLPDLGLAKKSCKATAVRCYHCRQNNKFI